MKIKPKCLFENKPAAYTSDGYMLPCCWMDDPPVYRYVVESGLKDEELLLSNHERLDDIFTSDQWENFFRILLYDPENSSYMCKRKCGVDVDKKKVKEEMHEEMRYAHENYR